MASKKDFIKFVKKNKTLTFGDLEKIVNQYSNISGNSIGNPSLSKKFVFEEIFFKYFEKLKKENVDFNNVVITTTTNLNDKIILNSNGFTMLHILRECEYKI